MIQCRDLRHAYTNERHERVEALGGIDLDVSQGKFLSVLGPSGCGKSTLLNLIAGFIRPTHGTLLFDGHAIDGPAPERGVVFQEDALFPWLNVLANVTFGLRACGVETKEARDQGRDFLGMVGLRGFEQKYPSELSGGMRQRVALARVLVNEPLLLLLDEPFGALDAQTRIMMQDELEAIWQRTRQTVLLITHSIDEAIHLGDQVAVMTARPGRVKEHFDVTLDRPRDRASDAFNLYRRRATELLKEEVRRAFEEQELTQNVEPIRLQQL